MNTQISAAAELELRKHVERAVRPVRATEQRKLKMREELLAHLTAIYAEEMEKSGSEDAAIASSCQRFGQPVEIMAELNQSLGAAERWAGAVEQYERRLDAMFRKWPGESVPRYIVRGLLTIAVLTVGMTVGMMLLVCGITWSIGGTPDAGTLYLLPRVVPFMIVGNWTALFAAWCVDTMTAKGLRRWLLLLLQSGLWSLLLTVAAVWFWWSISDAALTAAWIVRLGAEIWGVIAVMLLMVAFLSRYARHGRQLREAWTKLEIGE